MEYVQPGRPGTRLHVDVTVAAAATVAPLFGLGVVISPVAPGLAALARSRLPRLRNLDGGRPSEAANGKDWVALRRRRTFIVHPRFPIETSKKVSPMVEYSVVGRVAGTRWPGCWAGVRSHGAD